ncbi:uncharacterized protein LOC114841171 [Diachasma alloeum]|uniref:Ionotropic receptor 141 n=1 Tax=Diachasma alloeum TaxID=454923 RepID=A0A4E0RM81_9HYME|nr:uncharacterized protein LOC114841171 [Diachasma alloeum]THK32848.1 ionotropic receptor 141 [Diachasma alloeum]
MECWLALIMAMMLPCVRTIVIPEEENLRIEDPSNRELINPETDVAKSELNELSKTVVCLMKFVELYMNQLPSRISVLLMETDDPDFSGVYLSKLQQVRSTYILNGYLDSDSDQNTSLDALLILKSYENLENSTSRLIDLCGRDCRYAVVVTNLFPDEASFMEEAVNYVKLLWIKRVANVVILGPVGNTLLAAQSQGFLANKLTEPSDPIPIGKCHQGEWITTTEVFPVLKMNNSHIHFAIIDHEPYMSVTWEGDHMKARGIELKIINILRDTLQFRSTGSLLEWDEGNTVEDEIIEEFKSDRKIDLVVGGLLRTMVKDVDFALPYDVTQVVWLVPSHSNISLLGLISPFTLKIWILTIASIIFGGMIKSLLFDKMSFLEIMALVIGVAWHKQPKRLSYRIKFMSWVLFGYVLTQVYLASLAGQLLAHGDLQINTMQELVDSGLIFGGTANHKQFFMQTDDDNDGEISAVDTIYKQFIVFSHEDYMKKLTQLMQGENTSLALVAVLNISSASTSVHHEMYHIVKETLATTPLAFPAWRGLPYLTQIDSKLAALIQGGIISYIANNETTVQHIHDAIEEKTDANLELVDIAPSFLLLVMGHGAGMLCLLGEFAVFRWQNRKPKKVVKGTKVRRLKGVAKRTVRFDEKNLRLTKPNNGVRLVLRPNVTIGYRDGRLPWKIV